MTIMVQALAVLVGLVAFAVLVALVLSDHGSGLAEHLGPAAQRQVSTAA